LSAPDITKKPSVHMQDERFNFRGTTVLGKAHFTERKNNNHHYYLFIPLSVTGANRQAYFI
jgi:hypothetical protein